MIISHSRQFVFIKTNKTAGTSIEIALSRYCSTEDVITPLSEEDDAQRHEDGSPGPCNYVESFRHYGARDWLEFIRTGQRKKKHWNHQTLEQLAARTDIQHYDNYLKFAFTRNPYERVLSRYYFKYPNPESRPSLDEYLDKPSTIRNLRKNTQATCLSGRCGMDKIYLYENLPEALDEIARRLGLGDTIELPRAKTGFRGQRESAARRLTSRQKARIQELVPEDWALYNNLGYLDDGP